MFRLVQASSDSFWWSPSAFPVNAPLHTCKDSQTNFTWKTNNFGLWRSNRTYIITFKPHPTAYRSSTNRSYLKDTTQFINFIAKRKLPKKCDFSLNGWLPTVSFNSGVTLGSNKLFYKGSTMCAWNSRGKGKHHLLLSLGTGDFTLFHLPKEWMPRSSPNGGWRGFQMTGALLDARERNLSKSRHGQVVSGETVSVIEVNSLPF